MSSVPSDLLDSVRGTISGVLDFIVETLSTSPEEIAFPRAAEEIEEEARETMIALGVLPDFSNQDDQMLQDFEEVGSDDADEDDVIPNIQREKSRARKASVEDASMNEKRTLADYISDDDDDEKEIYSLVLWNDESHSFDEVIKVVSEATNCTPARARAVAEAVDSHVCIATFLVVGDNFCLHYPAFSRVVK